MTELRNHQSSLRHELDRILEHLKQKGIRITDTRRAVLTYMMESKEHPSAEMIYQDLKLDFPSMSLATVYNNLKVLVEEGYVSELKISQDNTTYYDFMGHQHLNVVCEICGKIADVEVDLPDLQDLAAKNSSYTITKSQIVIYGICPACASKGKAS